MNASLYLTLLNPAASTIFAAAFFGLWRHQPGRRYLIWLWTCYAASGAGFVLQSVDLPIGHAPTRVLSGVCFATAAFCMGSAIALKYGRRPRYLALALLGLAGVTGVAWFWYVPDAVMRIYSMSFAIGAMVLVSAAPIVSHRDKNFIDYALLSMCLLQGMLFFVRTYLTVNLGGVENPDDLRSPFWLILSFSHAILTMILVFILILDAALDIERDLKAESKTDQLSGLLNRRGFEAAVVEKIGSARSGSFPISLVLCDLDHFKSINDTFGHHIGDEVIGTFSRTMKDIVGSSHFTGRIGGEEFSMLIVGGDASVAELIAQGVRIGFSAAASPAGSVGVARHLTASFGVAQLLPGESYDKLLDRADAALYRAKGDGRDCVRVAPDQPDERAGFAPRADGAPVDRWYRASSSVDR